MTTGHSEPTPGLSPLVSVEEVRLRLGAIFPPSFPDRALLVGKMAARVVFVFLYGGFVEGTQRHLRPSAIYFFTADQARQTTDAARLDWLKTAFKPGFRPPGKRWYADTSREPIRDDLISRSPRQDGDRRSQSRSCNDFQLADLLSSIGVRTPLRFNAGSR